MDRRRKGYLTCPLAVFDDEPKRISRHAFDQHSNRVMWDGPKAWDGRQTGGGRWVSRRVPAHQDEPHPMFDGE